MSSNEPKLDTNTINEMITLINSHNADYQDDTITSRKVNAIAMRFVESVVDKSLALVQHNCRMTLHPCDVAMALDLFSQTEPLYYKVLLGKVHPDVYDDSENAEDEPFSIEGENDNQEKEDDDLMYDSDSSEKCNDEESVMNENLDYSSKPLFDEAFPPLEESISMTDEQFTEGVLKVLLEKQRSCIPIQGDVAELLKRTMYSFVVHIFATEEPVDEGTAAPTQQTTGRKLDVKCIDEIIAVVKKLKEKADADSPRGITETNTTHAFHFNNAGEDDISPHKVNAITMRFLTNVLDKISTLVGHSYRMSICACDVAMSLELFTRSDAPSFKAWLGKEDSDELGEDSEGSSEDEPFDADGTEEEDEELVYDIESEDDDYNDDETVMNEIDLDYSETPIFDAAFVSLNETISMSDDYFRENILNGMMEDRKSFIPIAENATGLLKRAMYSFVVSTLLE